MASYILVLDMKSTESIGIQVFEFTGDCDRAMGGGLFEENGACNWTVSVQSYNRLDIIYDKNCAI